METAKKKQLQGFWPLLNMDTESLSLLKTVMHFTKFIAFHVKRIQVQITRIGFMGRNTITHEEHCLHCTNCKQVTIKHFQNGNLLALCATINAIKYTIEVASWQ